MRTVGQILREKRIEKRFNHDYIERQIRIRSKFLQALEDNAWDKMPSLPYIKGFLKTYSSFLGLDPQEMIAIFRRQYHELQKETDKVNEEPEFHPGLRITPRSMIVASLAAAVGLFFGFLFFQYRAISTPPPLEIASPAEGAVTKEAKLEVEGITDRNAVISINNRAVAVDENGHYKTTVSLSPGINKIVVESVNKNGKKRTISRTVAYQATPDSPAN